MSVNDPVQTGASPRPLGKPLDPQDCCCSGSQVCDCTECVSLCLFLSDLQVTLGASTFNVPDLYQTVFLDGLPQRYTDAFSTVAANVHSTANIFAVRTCIGTHSINIGVGVLITVVNTNGVTTHAVGAPQFTFDTDCDFFDGEVAMIPFTSTFFGGTTTGTLTVSGGTCSGDTAICCPDDCTISAIKYFCCNGGGTWFCSPEIPPVDTTPLTATVISGPLTGITFSLIRGNVQLDGKCILFQTNDAPGDHAYLGIDCNGDLHGAVDVMAVVSPGRYWEQQIIGTLTATNSCNPLDFEITITAGPLAGNVIRVTE